MLVPEAAEALFLSSSEPYLPGLNQGNLAPTTVSGRPQRNYRVPRRFQDILPEPPVPISSAEDPLPDLGSPQSTFIRRVRLIVRDRLQTAANYFGLWRDYPRRPSFDPDGHLTLEDLSNVRPVNSLASSVLVGNVGTVDAPEAQPLGSPALNRPSYWPFANKTIHGFMQWLNNGNTTKSESEANALVKNWVLSPDFCVEDMANFNVRHENRAMDKELVKSGLQNQFKEVLIEIDVPSGSPAVQPKKFPVQGLLCRKLTSVICDAFGGPLAHLIHYSPFQLFHNTEKGCERVYGELFTSDAFLCEHEDVQRHGRLPPDDLHCRREKVVAALMLASDATHLADFGNAKAWPVYMMLGNISKYVRSQPNSGAIQHLAYMPSVS